MQVSWIDADKLKDLVALIAPEEAGVIVSRQSAEIEATPPLAEAAEVAVGWMDLLAEPRPTAPANESLVVEPAVHVPHEEELKEGIEESHEQALHNAAAALPLSRIRDKLRAIRQRATEAGILTRTNEPMPAQTAALPETAVVAAMMDVESVALKVQASNEIGTARINALAEVPSQAPAFEIPQGSREERLAAFAGWAKQVLHKSGGHVLVINDDGEVLWGGEAKAGLVLSTMMAWGSAMHANTLPTNGMPAVIHRTLASGHVLTVIPCETSTETMHVAVVAPEGVADTTASLLRGALCAAIS